MVAKDGDSAPGKGLGVQGQGIERKYSKIKESDSDAYLEKIGVVTYPRPSSELAKPSNAGPSNMVNGPVGEGVI